MKFDFPSELEIVAMFSHIRFSVGNEIMRESYRSGTYTKHGIKYKSLPNRSSAPFESFARQSGKLSDSIDVEVKGEDIYIGSSVHYLKYLELGTKKMLPRPTLQIAYNKTDKFAIIDKIVKKVFR